MRARANLTAEQYEKADRAHMKDGAFVKVKRETAPQAAKPRQLSDIRGPSN